MPDPDPPSSPLSYRSGPEGRIDYVTPEQRSVGKWLVLCVVWIVGLGVWGLYMTMIIVLAYRWFGAPAE